MSRINGKKTHSHTHTTIGVHRLRVDGGWVDTCPLPVFSSTLFETVILMISVSPPFVSIIGSVDKSTSDESLPEFLKKKQFGVK